MTMTPLRPEPTTPRPPATAQVLDEADAFRQSLLDAGVAGAVGELLGRQDRHGRNLQDPARRGELRDQLLGEVRAGRPLSLIRLGDGEGNTLFWAQRAAAYPALARLCMNRIWGLMFGRQFVPTSVWDALGAQMEQAVRHATHLGMPTPQQFATAAARYADLREPDFDLRGQTGILAVWDWLALHPGVAASPDTVVVNWHVHKSLLSFYGDLVRAAGNVSVVTCYPELLPVLQRECEVSDGEAWLIPPQAVNIKSTPAARHYPAAFEQIVADIGRRDRRGQLVFVGAGLPGKAYCEAVRKAGGMAIDVGSLMDVWMGLGVRPYQSPDFVAAHRLQPGPARATPEPPPAGAPRNELEIQVFGLRRSGNHAVLSWLIANLPQPAHFLNNVDAFSDPFVGFHNATLPNTVPLRKPMTEAQTESLRVEPKHCLIYNYEHLPLAQLRQRPLLADHDATLGSSARTLRLLILRDFWNWMASRAKQLVNRGVPDPEKLQAVLAREAMLWKQYAREFEGRSQLIARDGFLTVNYNEFVASDPARERLLASMGLPLRSLAIDHVPDLGLGSSFDGTAFDGQAQKMDVGGRWKYLTEEPLLAGLLATWRADEDLLAVNERLFGLRDPIGAALLAARAAQRREAPDARALLLSLLPKGGRGAEIGVHLGDFSARLLDVAQPRELLLIDPWQLAGDSQRRGSWYGPDRGVHQAEMDARHAGVLQRFAAQAADGQVRVLRQDSHAALACLDDGALDWIYIDGDHRYETVRDDLELALAKVRAGGLICGDDYGIGSWWKDGVVRAVNEFIGRAPVRIVLVMGTQFVLEKLAPPQPAPGGA